MPNFNQLPDFPDWINHSVELETIRHILQDKGFSVQVYRRNFHDVRIDCIVTASEIIPDDKVEEYKDYTAKTKYQAPATTSDYFKAWLVRFFPYLTAPVFQPKLKDFTARVDVKQKVITKYNKIFIGAGRREWIEEVPSERLLTPPLSPNPIEDRKMRMAAIKEIVEGQQKLNDVLDEANQAFEEFYEE